jgi:SIR2-like domain
MSSRDLTSDRSALPLLVADYLRNQPETVVFLFGSGMVTPSVPGVHGVVEMARDWTQKDEAGSLSDALEPTPSAYRRIGPEDYDRTMDRVLHRFAASGQRAFVQRLALEAFRGDDADDLRRRLEEPLHTPLTREEFGGLVDRVDDWTFPPGMAAFARLFRSYSTLPKIILTTNFDPLLTVALKREGLAVRTVTATTDTHLPADRTIEDAAVVLHLHGDCFGEPTLHTREELATDRPNIRRLLAEYLRDRNLLVVGYSGWDDIVRTTLEATLDPGGGLEVMWAVHEPDEAALESVHPHLSSFLDSHHPQTIAYMGIDRDTLFADVLQLTVDVSDVRPVTQFVRVAQALRDRFGFGIDLTRTSPEVLFWPHRLRSPHLIHGVHALAGAAVAKTDVRVELHIDDLGLDPSLADELAEDFIISTYAWFDSVGVSPPAVTRLSQDIDLDASEVRHALWGLAEELNQAPITGAEVLGAWKLLDPSILDAGPAVATQHLIQALRRPLRGHLISSLYTFLALKNLIESDVHPDAIVTLGGADERPMWDLWRYVGPRVGHIFVPRLDWRSESGLWGIRPLQRGSEYGSRDLAAFLVAAASEEGGKSLIDWIWTCGVHLREWIAYDATVAIVDVGGETVRSADDVFKVLTRKPTRAQEIADAVGRWFYAPPPERTLR